MKTCILYNIIWFIIQPYCLSLPLFNLPRVSYTYLSSAYFPFPNHIFLYSMCPDIYPNNFHRIFR